MGFLSNLFKQPSSDIEAKLEELYTNKIASYSGRPKSEVKMEVQKAIQICKQQSFKEGTNDLQDRFGSFLISNSVAIKSKGITIVENALEEGAKEDDIEEWWNLHDLQRRMIVWHETTIRYASFLEFKEEGFNPDEAMAKVRKIFPMYGEPNDTEHTSGDDRPLPQALRGRVDKYREKYGAEYILEKSKTFNTYNAFIRSEIQNERL